MKWPWINRKQAQAEGEALLSQNAALNAQRIADSITIGELRGRVHVLEASLNPDVLDQMASRVAWYEDMTRLVIGGRVESSSTHGLRAGNIRCERCKRQIAQPNVIKHLVEHGFADGVIPLIKLGARSDKAALAAIDRLLKEDAVDEPAAPKPQPRKKKPARAPKK